MSVDHAELAAQILEGDRLALARSLTLIENGQPQGFSVQRQLYPYTGKAHLVGITGAPGTGKSTLVNRLALALREAKYPPHEQAPPRVAIVAVDPSSPFSGGAILGDRIRMRDLSGDAGIFIRSMASRGALGGLARTTGSFVEVLDAAGFEIILIETVGAGQAEVEIARTAHTTIVIDAPGLGDDVQAIKAGILEIADILVVNKADLPGAENTLQALRSALSMAGTGRQPPVLGAPDPLADGQAQEGWSLPILSTVATQGEGTQALVQAIAAHRAYLQASGEWGLRERERVESQMHALLRSALMRDFMGSKRGERYSALLERVLKREVAPVEALEQLLGKDPT